MGLRAGGGGQGVLVFGAPLQDAAVVISNPMNSNQKRITRRHSLEYPGPTYISGMGR